MAYQAYAALDSILKTSLAKKRADVDKSLKMIQMGMEKMKLDEAIASSRLSNQLTQMKIDAAVREESEYDVDRENELALMKSNITSAQLTNQAKQIEIKRDKEKKFLENLDFYEGETQGHAELYSNMFSDKLGMSPIFDPDEDNTDWVNKSVTALKAKFNIPTLGYKKIKPFLEQLASSAWASRVGKDFLPNLGMMNDLKLSIARSNAGIAESEDKKLISNFTKIGVVYQDEATGYFEIDDNFSPIFSTMGDITENLDMLSGERKEYYSKGDIVFDTKDQLNKIELAQIENILDTLNELKDNNEIKRQEQATIQAEEELRLVVEQDAKLKEFAKQLDDAQKGSAEAISFVTEEGQKMAKDQVIDDSKARILELENSLNQMVKEMNVPADSPSLDSLYNAIEIEKSLLDAEIESRKEDTPGFFDRLFGREEEIELSPTDYSEFGIDMSVKPDEEGIAGDVTIDDIDFDEFEEFKAPAMSVGSIEDLDIRDHKGNLLSVNMSEYDFRQSLEGMTSRIRELQREKFASGQSDLKRKQIEFEQKRLYENINKIYKAVQTLDDTFEGRKVNIKGSKLRDSKRYKEIVYEAYMNIPEKFSPIYIND